MFGIVIYKVRMYPGNALPTMEEMLTARKEDIVLEVLSGQPLERPIEQPDPEWVLGLRRPHSRLTRVKKRWPA